MERLLEISHEFRKVAGYKSIYNDSLCFFILKQQQQHTQLEASPVAQRYRLHLPTQGNKRAVTRETLCATQGPACATAPEPGRPRAPCRDQPVPQPLSLCSRVQEPPPLRPKCPGACSAARETGATRSPHSATGHRAHSPQLEKTPGGNKHPAQPKTKQVRTSERESKITARLQLYQRE